LHHNNELAPVLTYHSTLGYRAELALTFLWKAARGGWTDAYLEMELALSFQSLMFKEKRESLAADKTRVAMASAAGARRA